MSDEEQFYWSRDEAVIIKPVQAIAVYRNGSDDIVIRQERHEFQDDDPYVVVPQAQLSKLIDALRKELG